MNQLEATEAALRATSTTIIACKPKYCYIFDYAIIFFLPSTQYLIVTVGGLLLRIASISSSTSGVSFLYARTASMFS